MSIHKYEWTVGESPPPLEVHSKAKHDVLRSYIARYIEVLTANPRRESLNLTLVDGFAGGGVYQYCGSETLGSPMILLQEVDCARAHLEIERRKQFKLNADFIFVEQSANNRSFLERTIRASAYGRMLGESVHVVGGDFEDAVPGIIDRIRKKSRGQRSIFFLDQYGYTHVSLQTIRTLLSSLENPEIIITFNVDYLIDYMNDTDGFLKAVIPVELGIRTVREMLAMKDQGQSRWVIQNTLYRHLREQTAAPYYTCFFIKSPGSHRAYWLIHISKHPKARDEMAMRHWSLQNHFVHHGRPGLNMLGYDPDQNSGQTHFEFMFDGTAEAQSRAALSTELLPIIFDHSTPTRRHTLETLFSRICNDTPATAKQIGGVLVELRNAKEIEIVTFDGLPKPRSEQVNWKDVILPARQRSIFRKHRSPLVPT
jgi:three-Cys-motif partner protein